MSFGNSVRVSVFISTFALLASAFEGGTREISEPPAPANASAYAKVAVLQWNEGDTPVGVTAAEAERYKVQLRGRLADEIRVAAAHGAKWIVTPEFAIPGYPHSDNFVSRKEVEPYIETIPGPTTRYFSRIARELKVYLHIGIAEVDATTGTYYNSVAAIRSDGTLAARHRKVHLYGSESSFVSTGKAPTYYQSPFGKVAIGICADVMVASFLNQCHADGADVLAVSSSWVTTAGLGVSQGAAQTTHATVLNANTTYAPGSGVINADGTVQSRLTGKGIAYGYVLLR